MSMTIQGREGNGGCKYLTNCDTKFFTCDIEIVNMFSLLKRIEHITFIILSVIFLFPSPSDANETEARRIQISLAIFPRIVAVDHDLNKKLTSSGKVRLVFIYEVDPVAAAEIAASIRNNVTNIGGKAVEITVKSTDEIMYLDQKRVAGTFLVERLTGDAFTKVMRIAEKKGIVVFSPFVGDVERGATVGIAISSRIKPYFNMRTLTKSHIDINEKLLNISKRYE